MKNKLQAIHAIQKDCQLQAEYYSRGKTCAIGCLALLSGVSKKSLVWAGGDSVESKPCSIASKITKKFGLSMYEQQQIQDLNDGNGFDLATRRRLIVKYLKSIKTRGRE